jgi:hypothetical protein
MVEHKVKLSTKEEIEEDKKINHLKPQRDLRFFCL